MASTSTNVMPVQKRRPQPSGSMSGLGFPTSSARRNARFTTRLRRLRDDGEERGQDREERHALDERRGDDHGRPDVVLDLGLTGDRLDRGGADPADAVTGSDDHEAGSD